MIRQNRNSFESSGTRIGSTFVSRFRQLNLTYFPGADRLYFYVVHVRFCNLWNCHRVQFPKLDCYLFSSRGSNVRRGQKISVFEPCLKLRFLMICIWSKWWWYIYREKINTLHFHRISPPDKPLITLVSEKHHGEVRSMNIRAMVWLVSWFMRCNLLRISRRETASRLPKVGSFEWDFEGFLAPLNWAKIKRNEFSFLKLGLIDAVSFKSVLRNIWHRIRLSKSWRALPYRHAKFGKIESDA